MYKLKLFISLHMRLAAPHRILTDTHKHNCKANHIHFTEEDQACSFLPSEKDSAVIFLIALLNTKIQKNIALTAVERGEVAVLQSRRYSLKSSMTMGK